MITVTQQGVPTELVVNGEFEGGFAAANQTYGSGQVAAGWGNFSNSNPNTAYSEGGVPGDYEQNIGGGSLHDGITQWLSMPANRTYLLTADVFVESGGAKLLIQSVQDGGSHLAVRASTRLGAQRLSLQFSHTVPDGAPNLLVAVFTSTEGSNIRVDHVSLRASMT